MSVSSTGSKYKDRGGPFLEGEDHFWGVEGGGGGGRDPNFS